MSRSTHLIVKHGFDRVAATVLFLLLSPFLAGLSLLLLVSNGWPVLFVQERVGVNGKPFWMYKFRTMVHDAVRQGLGTTVGKSDDRITRVGAWLRSWSLDELPQLLNVLTGEMSLVGPRPTLGYQVAQYTPWQWRRLEMKPGITGWAQVNGRNALPWSQRIELDIWYVDHFSFWLDVRILWRTVGVFLRREGLYGTEGVNDDFGSPRQP